MAKTKQKEEFIIFRLRGKGESMRDAKRRKRLIVANAIKCGCSQADVMRSAIDTYLLEP